MKRDTYIEMERYRYICLFICGYKKRIVIIEQYNKKRK